MNTRVAIETWGCQMNLRQSEGIAGILESAGYEIVENLADADVVLFNGCSVRQKAEEKLYGRIGAVVEERRSRPVLLGVGGCVGQIHGEALLGRIAAIDFVFGSSGHDALPELIRRASSERIAQLSPPTFETEVHARRRSRVTAMVTITEGCSNYCTYCVVPYARGAMRSRPQRWIFDEVDQLAANGYRDVLLLGQNVNAYGTDLEASGDFADLLTAIARRGVPRVRFTTSHPKDLADRLLHVMAEESTVCPHLHLACQSGADRILQAMGRRYDRDRYLALAAKARRIVPGLNITTDLIVGFPGETDEDFEQTMDLVERVRFGTIFAAKYSPRPRTRAAQWPDDVPDTVKEERLERVLSRQRAIALEENGRFVGQEVEVLVEGITSDRMPYGRAPDHRTVVCRGRAQPGETVIVRVEGASASSLSGGILVGEEVGGKT